ncbi:MAG: glycosyltransferase [Candidatus Krumholzibacteriota bacterium]|nr:glycosyltransferase [Candidatus Krumholzibacteriota bacterium]
MNFENLKGESLRRIIAVIAILVTIYYLFWRVTETLNPNALILAWALYGAEIFAALVTFLFYFTVWKPVTRTSPEPLRDRTVDVFVPTKNEEMNVLRKTLLGCNDIKYPHRTVVLDDGDRPEVRALCSELDVVYLARPSHEHAKAGNLNYGLEHSEAEFVAVLDADHVPLPNFIDALIGYFKDEKLGFAQAPQEFYNIDSFQHRVDHKKKYVWAEQKLFYSVIQPGRDRWNAAYFVGSCALIRRKALDSIKGFAYQSVTEDMLTSIKLHARGWSSVYHHEHLAYGIAAETILPFHIQRVRWGMGGWQVFFRKNPLFIRGLSLPQRLCYLSSLIYPFEGFQKLIFYSIPPITLFTGILPMRALDINYLLHFVPYYAISLFAFNEMGRGFGGVLMLEQFSMGKFITYMKTLGVFLLPKRARRFKVTPKGVKSTAPYRLMVPQVLVILTSVIAILWALVQLLFQLRNDEFIIAVNSLWALYNTGLGISIVQYARQKLFQRREDFRIPDSVPVLYGLKNRATGDPLLAVANNLTKEGLSLLSVGSIPEDEELRLEIVLPNRIIAISGKVVHSETVSAGEKELCRSGFRFAEINVAQQDDLSRYLYESAVMKFLQEYSTRYETYLEKTFQKPREYKRRANRNLAYFPVIIPEPDGSSSFGVIKDISSSGFLLASQHSFAVDDEITVATVLGDETISLSGKVARAISNESDDYPLFVTGVGWREPQADAVSNLLKIADQTDSLITSR